MPEGLGSEIGPSLQSQNPVTPERGGVPPAELRQAAISGQPWGEPAAAAHRVSEEMTKAGREEYGAELGVDKARAEIEGVKDAQPRVLELATKIVGRFGEVLSKKGDRMMKRAERQKKRAAFHVKGAVEAREKLLQKQEQQREGEIARTLTESVPPWLAKRLGFIAGRGEGMLERFVRVIKEGYHEFFARMNTKRAERNSLVGGFYSQAGRDITRIAEEIMGRWPEVRERRLTQVNSEEEEMKVQLAALQERLRALQGQFEQITKEGPPLARAESVEVTKPAAEAIAAQKEPVERLTQQISQMKGTGN